MTGDDSNAAGRRLARATIRTQHADPDRDEERVDPNVVADALAPDNTDQMSTSVADGAVVTTIERDDAAGLRSTVDDYLVNVDVAVRTAQHVNRPNDTNDT